MMVRKCFVLLAVLMAVLWLAVPAAHASYAGAGAWVQWLSWSDSTAVLSDPVVVSTSFAHAEDSTGSSVEVRDSIEWASLASGNGSALTNFLPDEMVGDSILWLGGSVGWVWPSGGVWASATGTVTWDMTFDVLSYGTFGVYFDYAYSGDLRTQNTGDWASQSMQYVLRLWDEANPDSSLVYRELIADRIVRDGESFYNDDGTYGCWMLGADVLGGQRVHLTVTSAATASA